MVDQRFFKKIFLFDESWNFCLIPKIKNTNDRKFEELKKIKSVNIS